MAIRGPIVCDICDRETVADMGLVFVFLACWRCVQWWGEDAYDRCETCGEWSRMYRGKDGKPRDCRDCQAWGNQYGEALDGEDRHHEPCRQMQMER